MSRAILATLTVLGQSMVARKYARRLENYQYALAYQRQDFPVCRKADYEKENEEHPKFVQEAYASQQQAWRDVQDLAGSMEDAYIIVTLHAETPAQPEAIGNYSYCRCPVCEAFGNAQEIDKEIRKGVWYWSPARCECAECAPITPPEDVEIPPTYSKWEVMGEQGADWA